VPELESQIRKETAELEVLRARGRGPLTVFERFRLANMEEEYRSLYNFLSCDAHSNIRALISRHIRFTEDDFEIAYYKDEPIESFISILDSTAALLLQASEQMHRSYASGKEPEVHAMLKELEAQRAAYVA
jgi:hypothetical protein